ncbi:hypothetical protein Tco_0379346 [Tanacetum coccineum]
MVSHAIRMKNAPSRFPKKVDKCFGTESFHYSIYKFSTTQSTIDAEINACINTLEKLKIYYLDKQEVTLRTDCQAIISFYNKTNINKSSRVRWIKFADAVTGTGVKINIEGISSNSSLLSGGSSTVRQCLSEEYEDYLRRSHEDFQPLPRIFIKTIFTPEERICTTLRQKS